MFGPASDRSSNEPIYVLMVNDGEFGRMALNWFAVASARRIPGLESGAVRSGLLYGIDHGIVRKATSSGIPALAMQEYAAPKPRQGYPGPGVKRWVWPLVADLLSAGYSVAFMDADALLLQPLEGLLRDTEPQPIDISYSFDKEQRKWAVRVRNRTSGDFRDRKTLEVFPPQVYSDADVLAQHEMLSNVVPDHSPLNTGVVFFRAGCRALMLAETFLNLVEVQPNGQFWFNHLLKSPSLAAVRVGMFSRKHAASTGKDWRQDVCMTDPTAGPQIPSQLAVIHFQVGHKRKASLMRECGLWELADP